MSNDDPFKERMSNTHRLWFGFGIFERYNYFVGRQKRTRGFPTMTIHIGSKWTARLIVAFACWSTSCLPRAAQALNDAAELMKRGDYSAAEAAYRRAIAEDPSASDAHLGLGYALSAQGKSTDAINVYQEAISLQPNWVMTHIALATEYARSKRFQDALGAIDAASRLGVNDARLNSIRGFAYYGAGRYAEAVKTFDEVDRVCPSCLTEEDRKAYRDSKGHLVPTAK